MCAVYTTGRSGASTKSDDFTKFKLDWLDKVARDPDITDFTFRAAYVLVSTFFNRQTRTAFPSQKTIASLINGKEEGVRAAFRRLAKAGHLGRKRRGKGRSTIYSLIVKNRDGHPGIDPSIGGRNGSGGMTITKNRDRHTEKPGSPSRHNPSSNPMINPLSAEDDQAGSLATAPPTGALARPPKREQIEAKQPVREKNFSAAPSVRTPNPHADQQRCEREIADVIGWDRLCELPDDARAELCRRWSEKKIGPEQLRVEVPNSAPVAAVTPAQGIGDGTDPADLIRAARSKRAKDCSRPELEALHAEKRARQNGCSTGKPLGLAPHADR